MECHPGPFAARIKIKRLILKNHKELLFHRKNVEFYFIIQRNKTSYLSQTSSKNNLVYALRQERSEKTGLIPETLLHPSSSFH